MVYIDVLYLWINYEKSSFPDLLLLTLRISKFTYEYVYMYLTSTYNLSTQQFLRFLSQPFLWNSVKVKLYRGYCWHFIFYTEQVLSGSRVGLCRVEVYHKYALTNIALDCCHNSQHFSRCFNRFYIMKLVLQGKPNLHTKPKCSLMPCIWKSIE